jgi:ketosteroid isomerase-like protein
MPARRGGLFLAGLSALLCACQQAPIDQSAAAADAVRAADIAWEQVFTAGDTSAAVAAIEPTGSMLPPNMPIATGREAIRKVIEGFYGMPGMALHWQVAKAEASTSGDLGYSMGTYQLSFNDPKGQAVSDHGKYVTVWRKQADGTWKVVADIFNSDLPALGM